jgi:hypothetical protein
VDFLGDKMQKTKSLLKWLGLAWPLLIPLVLGLFHWLVFSTAGKDPVVNKIFAGGVQLIGGLIVLYSINENLGVFRNHGIATVIKNYFRKFPLCKARATIVEASVGSFSMSGSGSARITTGHAPATVEERLAALEKEIVEVRTQFSESEKQLHKRVNQVQSEVQKNSEKHRQGIKTLADRLERTVVGGIKLQALGVLLVVYGAFISVFV